LARGTSILLQGPAYCILCHGISRVGGNPQLLAHIDITLVVQGVLPVERVKCYPDVSGGKLLGNE